MYKYELKKQLFHRMFVKRTPGTKWWDTQFQAQLEFLDTIGVTDRSDGWRIIHALSERFKYHVSPVLVDKVPVYGYLIPAEVFEVTKI